MNTDNAELRHPTQSYVELRSTMPIYKMVRYATQICADLRCDMQRYAEVSRSTLWYATLRRAAPI